MTPPRDLIPFAFSCELNGKTYKPLWERLPESRPVITEGPHRFLLRSNGELFEWHCEYKLFSGDTEECDVVCSPDEALHAAFWFAVGGFHHVLVKNDNIDAVVHAAAKYEDPQNPGVRYAFRLDDGAPVPLTNQQVDDLWVALSGHEVSEIRDAIFALNDYLPQVRLEALVKGFGAATRSETK